MSIATRINSMENNIRNAYHGLDSIGIDTTNTNKNIENISALLDDFYDSLPKVSGTGSNIQLTPTKKGRITSQINGDTFQQTYTGKNLLPYENTTTTTSGVTITHNEDGSITLNGTSTANITYRLWNGYKTGILEANKSYVLSSQVDMPSKTTLRLGDSSSSNIFVDLSSQATIKNYIKVNSSRFPTLSVYFFLFIYSGYTFDNYTIYPMLEEGTSMTSFEPYVGGTESPNPLFPQNIQSVTGTQNITVCGKNLFDKNNVIENKYLDSNGNLNDNNAWIISNYIRVNPNETIYYKGLTQVGTAPYSAYYDINKNFISSFKQQIGSNNSITIPSNAYYIRFSVNHSASYHDENTFQVERNSNTTYEAYSGETYDINLGKNLYSSSLELGSIDTSTGQNVATNNAVRSKDFIAVLPNTTYTISNNNNYQEVMYFYKSDKSFINAVSGTAGNYTFTTPNNCYYVKNRTSMGLMQNDLTTKFQLEPGTEATSYSPYFTPIELNKIGDYKDYITGSPNNWSIVKQTNKVILNGSETWKRTSVSTTNSYAFWNTYSTLNIPTGVYGTKICNYFGYQNVTWDNSTPNHLAENGSSASSLSILFNVDNAIATTIDNWTSWLSTHNTEVYYVLETPTTTPITNTELISQLNAWYYAMSKQGQTNISVDGNLPIILDVSALKGN